MLCAGSRPDGTADWERGATILLNTSGARSSAAILAILAQQEGWAEVSGTKGHIFWVVSPEDLERRLLAKRRARTSHIPGMHALCKKAPFALLMRAHGSRFFPYSIIVPPDAPLPLRAIAAALREGHLILKPDDGTQGDGIQLICSPEEARRKLEAARASTVPQTMVLQRYLGEPLLLESSRGPLKARAGDGWREAWEGRR